MYKGIFNNPFLYKPASKNKKVVYSQNYGLCIAAYFNFLLFLCWDVLIQNCVQVSISPTFYEQLLRQIPFAKKLQTQIVST